jgi:hypothetical protein
MPHQFKAHPDHPAIAYLVRSHADPGGRIQANKAEAKRLTENMRHVEAVLKMFDPDYNVRAISARRRVQGNPWFSTLFRHALDALRAAQGPLTVREITDAVLAPKAITNATDKQRPDLEAGLRSSLETTLARRSSGSGKVCRNGGGYRQPEFRKFFN